MYENTESVSIMLTHASKGRLMSYLASWATICEQAIASFLDQLLSALEHCHTHGTCFYTTRLNMTEQDDTNKVTVCCTGIVHRDVKHENVLVLDGEEGPRVQLADFGLSACIRPRDKLRGFAGTAIYAAPEMLLGREYDEKADIFTFGVLTSVRSCIVGRRGKMTGLVMMQFTISGYI